MEFVNLGERLFVVYRKVKETTIQHGVEGVEFVKNAWHCDAVLKKEGYYFFCREVFDAKIAE